MNTSALFSRRKIVFAALGAGVAGKALTATTSHARTSLWEPANGLRLAGPFQGVASLDPALARDLDTIFITRQICRGLMGYDETLAPVPELAESMQVSADGRVYTFVLRDDGRFHDGRSIDAEDVRSSLTRAMHPTTAGGDVSQLSGPTYLGDIAGAGAVIAGETDVLDGIEVVDAKTVRITLEAPSSTFSMKLAAMPAAILDRHQDTAAPGWWASLNGSGPYRIVEFDAGSGMKLKAMESWRGEDIPIEDISIRLGLSAGQPVNLFQGGEIDLVPEVPPSLVSLVSDPATGITDAVVLEQPEFSLSYIAFGNQRPPLDDVHIRRALQMAFPADQFAQAAFDGRVRIAEGVIPPGMLGREWPAEMPATNVESARKEIAASRYGDAASVPPIRIHAADIAPIEALRDVVQEQLGLMIDSVQVNWFDFLNGLSARRWDAYGLFWGVDYPDPEALLQVLFGSESGENYTGYRNGAFDDLMARARQEADAVTRQEMYAEAQQLLIDDAAVIPLYVPVRYTLARRGMSHVPVTALGLLGLEALS